MLTCMLILNVLYIQVIGTLNSHPRAEAPGTSQGSEYPWHPSPALTAPALSVPCSVITQLLYTHLLPFSCAGFAIVLQYSIFWYLWFISLFSHILRFQSEYATAHSSRIKLLCRYSKPENVFKRFLLHIDSSSHTSTLIE